jgi:hypothetical protein
MQIFNSSVCDYYSLEPSAPHSSEPALKIERRDKPGRTITGSNGKLRNLQVLQSGTAHCFDEAPATTT